jgi:pyruvate, orthophosphate dikinase
MLYRFDHPHTGSLKEVAAKVGGKGASLWMMQSQLGLPVPPGFTLGIEACRLWQSNGWTQAHEDALKEGMVGLEAALGQMFGSGEKPLLVSVRSGAAASMPGMMDTMLNVGVTAESRTGLAKLGGEAFATDLEKRFLTQYARVVLGLGESLPPERLPSLIKSKRPDTNLDDAYQQLRASVEAVFASWQSPRAKAYRKHEGQSDEGGTAVTIQAMVFGNLSPTSCTGVLFTRDPATGAAGHTGDVLFQAQGEDVVAGTHTPSPLSALTTKLPQVADQLRAAADRIERHYRDMADIEFTVQDGTLFILQARVGKRTPQAAAKLAIDLSADPHIALTREEALARLPEGLLEGKLALSDADSNAIMLTHGVPASPGMAAGRLVFDPDVAVDRADEGWQIILARQQTCPADVHGMGVSAGIITALGGMMSHAAVVARGWGIPAVVGASHIHIDDDHMIIEGDRFDEGEVISIDGTTGAIYRGDVNSIARADDNLTILRSWAAQRDSQSKPSNHSNLNQAKGQMEDTHHVTT